MESKWVGISSLLTCPLCQRPVKGSHSSIVCEKRHCFDIARKGYINMLRKPSIGIYDATLFKNRQLIYRFGFYDKMIEAIDMLSLKYADANRKSTLVDAGCGDGTFIQKLWGGTDAVKIGFDISKDAILEASRGSREILWLVADLVSVPLRDCCADMVFNIFAPANYSSFKRILKRDGIMVKVVPGKEYLKELRLAAGNRIKNKEYDEGQVITYLRKNMPIIEMKNAHYKVPVNEEQINMWVKMTPMLANVSLEKEALSNISQVTIDVNICVCRRGC